jgi:flagellar assembly factor FliW
MITIAETVVPSAVFGTFNVPDDKIYRFQNGIPGLEEQRAFAFADVEEYRPLVWMISLDGTCHLPVIPFSSITANDIDDVSRDVYLPQLYRYLNENPTSLAYIVIQLNGAAKSISLKAPILVNPDTRTGTQYILDRWIISGSQKV